MKLTLKLSLLLSLVIAAVLTVGGLLALARESALLEQDVRRDARLVAEALASTVAAAAPPGGGVADPAHLVAQVGADESEVQIAWRAPGGTDAPHLSPAGQAALARGETVVDRVATPAGEAVTAWAPVDGKGGIVGVVEVSEPLVGRDAFVRRSVQAGFTAILCITLFSGLTGLVAGRALVGRRVVRLVEKTRQVARNDLTTAVPVEGSDELSTLAAALNTMAGDLAALQRHAAQEARARLEAEIALQHADRLRTVGVLAAGVAHELGTPLNVISGRAALVERRAGEDERLRTDAHTIREQADRITRIVRLMLDFSRHARPRARSCDLGELVGGTLELLSATARARGVSLARQAPEGRVEVVVDPEQIGQVVTNLVLNGIFATPEGGGVVVRVAPAAGGGARLEVRDDGDGVPEADRERIFDPFFTTRPPGEGTGLGLSIVQRIVQDHGGRIFVEAAPSGGAAFVVQLPSKETA